MMQNQSIILTPNNRLARYLQNQLFFAKGNLSVQRSEKILPFITWLTNCWLECKDIRILLNQYQERLLWQQIIKEVLGNGFNSITNTVMKAYELVINWQLSDTDWHDYEMEDIIVFRRLSKKFTEYCNEKNLITSYQLPLLLLPHFSCLYQDNLSITFAAFDEYSPQLQEFIDGLQKLGHKINYHDPNNLNNYLHKQLKLNFAKQEDEITAAARWTKQIINHDIKANIGIIVSNLTDLRPQIIKIFNEVLRDSEQSEKINISAGIIFGSLPVINSAFELLALHEPFDLKTISKILLSPYICGAEAERSNRELFDFQLRQINQMQFWLSDIEFLAKKYQKDISILIDCLKKMRDMLAQIGNKKLRSLELVKVFAQILKILGWPGSNLTDSELIAVRHFTELLNKFVQINLIVEKVSYIQALHILHDMAVNTVFQPKQETTSQINILGYLEAAGINFDYSWIMGLDQENWPTHPKPNPFIPISVQKKLDLPHSYADRELHFCKTLIDRFKRSAKKEIIFSYVKQVEDRVVEPSALIADVTETSVNNLMLAEFAPIAKIIYCSRKIEKLTDNSYLELTPDELKLAGGNSKLLESQSQCPFRAFAEFRLAAKKIKQFEPGVGKLKRGTLVHITLERFWREVKNHKNLCELDITSLQDIIEKSIVYALDKECLSQSLYLLEKKCLTRLLNRWIEVEKSRQPFQVIETEKNIQTTLGSLPIKLRIDRIDQLASGDLLLIDYKTGKNSQSIFDLFGRRPKSPQLPLYCIAVDSIQKIQGFAFAQINLASIKFDDIGLDKLRASIQKIDEASFKNNMDWYEFIVYWRTTLTELANNFISGYVKPEPLSTKVCEQCEFGILCRYSSMLMEI